MDETTKCRKRMDYARVCIIISVDQDIKTEVEVDAGRPTIFKIRI